MSKRRTALLLGLLPLVAAGLSACTTSSGRPQVQDLSVSRNSETPSTYTVKSGDTIYGIAWQNRVDFRDLAQLNGISPPYRLEPGQQLRLQSGASVGGGQAIASSGSGSGGVTATGLGGGSGGGAQSAGGDDNPSWLLPSDAGGAGAGNGKAAGQGSGQAAGGSGSSAGPVYAQNGAADGARNANPPANAAQGGSSGTTAARSTNADARQPAGAAEDVASASSGTADTGSSSSSASINAGSTKTATGADAGTEVAGEPSGAPDRSSRTYKPVENVPWQWPASGQLVGKFDDDSNITPGIDIAGQKGQPVKAAGPGIVVYAGDGVRGYGNLIILKHNDRFLSAYAHNDSLKVKENDVVEAGETIATMGQTDADQVELHFEVRVNGQPQDPLQYLPAR
ncbi:MAG: peptidoglycan DD-metalloendopeptidase family protein [Salinicola sp.]|uniref:peptidoglycan DD-metalloendopeptidase family protein n=1 Tax=Salinicola sp. TaxID=1978524 RepID=UPI001E18523F|nr:peptidoglycan DD-metalloendopeptidase family protein [Salinicola sp.]NRB57136.1 peptidoglycan DD-metalloendopeptidase family protein [Salinicola sp.]